MSKKRIMVLCVVMSAALSLVADKEVVNGIEWEYTISDGSATLGVV